MFLLCKQNICLILIGKKLLIINFGGYIFLYLPPFNSNFGYSEIKSLVFRTLNLREWTVAYEQLKYYSSFINYTLND